MPLIPVLRITQGSQCDKVTLWDITGSYDVILNPGGYGAPNSATSDIVSASVTFTNTTALTAAVTHSLTTVFAQLFLSPGVELTALTLLGQTKFPDGYYQIVYTLVDSSGVVYTFTTYQGFSCQSYCCFRRAGLTMEYPLCNYNEAVELAIAWSLFQALHYAQCCGLTDKYNTILGWIQKYCSGCGNSASTNASPANVSSGGCGCS